ncbi:hypothetical protein BCON_0067g00290 [Botryotinia convoluta]|uniref:Uncharacterized protein n=1 Tax=Botryotinia convoluta TaxID=54673 RepID=A0A4Z1I6V9_9HELO|nr:hypothetical protein BCON_0067g00290 [Botryotinia convoluta]
MCSRKELSANATVVDNIALRPPWRLTNLAVGPNELTIFKAQAVPVLDGVGTTCNKSPWYDLLIPRVSLATTRDKTMHDQRRRIWDRGFSTSALRDYENLLFTYALSLDQKIGSANGAPINVSRWFYLYSFDVMGRLAFGKSYNMLTDDKNHFAVNQLHNGMKFLGPFSPVPWLVRIGYSLPGIAVSWKKLLKWSRQQANERLQTGASTGSTRDIMSWLIDDSQKGNKLANDTNWVSGDAFAAVIAGSDTVASTLTYIFYHLCLDPDQIVKLRLELDVLESICDMAALRNLPHLNAIINETLRLHPALPTGGLRDTPSEGVTIADTYVPGNVTVCVPRYVLGRLEDSYEKPLDFIPERWYSRPEMVKDKSGFSPFSMGRHSCIGKNLSLMQLRSVIATLVTRYDISFGPNEDGLAVCRDMKDQFNQHPGKLDICFIPRAFTGKGM